MTSTIYYEINDCDEPCIVYMDMMGNIHKVSVKDGLLLGREGAGEEVDIAIDSLLISRRHGRFYKENNNVYYQDFDSKNSTYINGARAEVMVKEHQDGVALKNGDVIQIKGKNNLHSQVVAVLVYMAQDFEMSAPWEKIRLDFAVGKVTIGRNTDTEINITDETISRIHASFFQAKNGWAVTDHDSTNGVYVNNVRIEGSKYLNPMDVIRVAGNIFFFAGKILILQKRVGEGAHDVLNISIEERNVWSQLRKKTLLKNINIEIKSGEMVLILGGSGAGKTTFMNAVMGYEKADGMIRYGEADIYKEYEQMKYDIGFVPQQDLLRSNDTVYKTLYNAAEMKMPADAPQEGREKRVKEVLRQLGLEREKDSLVGKLSGGQRKRLSIAVEFVADPSLFFLDEPDSGLDGIMARSLMESLREIADQKKIVIVITHGPDRGQDLFDKVIVLAKSMKDNSGHLAFFGSIIEAYTFFGTHSLEGIVRKINRTDEGGEGLADFYIEKFESAVGRSGGNNEYETYIAYGTD